MTDGEFHRMIDQKEFAEWAEVYGHLYGTPWQELTQKRKPGQDVILDIDVQGARQVIRNLNDAVSVFVMPPSLEVLKDRLRGRGTDSPEVVERRFQQAQEEMKSYHEYDYTVSNGNLDQAVKEFLSIVLLLNEFARSRSIRPGSGRMVFLKVKNWNIHQFRHKEKGP